MIKHLRISVSGKVQNVGFRFHTRKTAQDMGIHGYVSNLPDGSVLIRAEGEEDNLDRFVEWCRQGPSWAEVTRLEVNEEPPEGLKDFQIR